MKARAGVTLVEVLVAIFIMAIGLLALLTLFPLGALSMAQALKDQRVSEAGQQASALANAFSVRTDPNVLKVFTSNGTAGPSSPVFADPWGMSFGAPATVGNMPSGVVRTNLSFTSTLPYTMLYCALQDELTFLDNGTPDLTSGLQHDPKTTWAYWLRRPSSSNPNLVELSVVVYYNRNLQLPSPENEILVSNVLYSATDAPTNIAVPNGTDIRRGMWIVDVTVGTNTGAIRGHWYRVTDTVDTAVGIQLDLQPEPVVPIQNIIIMEDVAEVFYKGTGWWR